MKSMKYMLFLCNGGLIDPQTSICTSFNSSFSLHALHFFSFILERYLIIFFSCKNFKACVLKWPYRRCESHELSTYTFMAILVTYFKFRKKLYCSSPFLVGLSQPLFGQRFCMHLLQSELCSLSPSFDQYLEDFRLGWELITHHG